MRIHPAALLLPLIGIAIICFSIFFSAHPVVLPQPREVADQQKSASSSGQQTTVYNVIDGDTIDVRVGGQKEVVRFIGINAPETYQGKNPECFAEEALSYVKNRIEGKSVSLVADATQENKDKYERFLRYVILEDGTNLNLELIQKGYAREYTYKIPYQHQKEFKDAQSEAKSHTVGLWRQCD